jgi:GNAT superfamily N-acetyltransferase
VIDIYPNDDPGRRSVSQLAMDAGYVRDYAIYTAEEMVRYAKPDELKPSWEQGTVEHHLVAYLWGEVVGLADVTRLSDGWRLVEPMHVLPRLWECGIGTKLWDTCAAWARRASAPGLRVWSLDRNERANGFYRGRGCQPVGVGTLTLIAHPELGIAAHTEPVTGYECRL